MVSLENRMPENWDAGDRLAFAIAGVSHVAAVATKGMLNPVRGFTDDYPTRLLQDLDFWIDQIRQVEKEVKQGEPSKRPAKNVG